MSKKTVLLGLVALVLAGSVLAQSAPAGPATPSGARRDGPALDDNGRLTSSAPSAPATAGSLPDTSAPPTVPAANTRRDGTRLLGAGAFNSSTGLEGAVNSGTPSMYDRKAGPRKVCPPGLENRNNVCVPPIGAVLSN